MKRQFFEPEAEWLDFLYDELSPEQRQSFARRLQAEPGLDAELASWQRLRKLCQRHIPEESVSPFLTRKVFNRIRELQTLPPARSWWAFWRPALLAVSVFTLSFAAFHYYFKTRSQSQPLQSAQREWVPPQSLSPLVSNPMPSFQSPPRWRLLAPSQYEAPGIRLAGYGEIESGFGEVPGMENIEDEAQIAVARFAHRQALRMRAMGDAAGAAQALGEIFKKYPQYPGLFEVLALRIDCLYQIGELRQAGQELAWLRQNSPELASWVERRWKR